jgi:integrase
MPKLSPTAVPSYRLHRQSGQAIVTLNGRDVCLGKYDTPESRDKYNRLIAEWLANGRQLPAPADAFTVAMLILAFWKHAEVHYRRPDGSPTSEVDNYKDVLKVLRRLYGDTLASKFGPLSLKTLRNEMIKLGWCRTNINRQVNRIRHVFKWGVENEVVPPSVDHGLAAVSGLSKGRSEARESDPVKPVPEHLVTATLDHVNRYVAGMVRLQLHSGARPGEVVVIRGCDVDTTGKVWIYRPESHKTAHHGHERVIYLGPQARAVVEEFLKTDTKAYLFSPADAERERREAMHEARKLSGTPLSCGNVPGSNVQRKPRKQPGERYGVEAYCKAIYAACDKAFPLPSELARHKVKGKKGKNGKRWESVKEWRDRLGTEKWAEVVKWWADHRWHPHQLRHNAATRLRKQYGLEAARVVLGHRSAAVAEVYAEIDRDKARQIMGEVG